MAAPDNPQQQFVDKRVFGSAERRDVKPGGGQEGARIDAPAMGGVENYRPTQLGRLDNLEGWIELLFYVTHEK